MQRLSCCCAVGAVCWASIVGWSAGLHGMEREEGACAENPARPRARELGIRVGILTPGANNAITDVPDVLVGHCTVWSGDNPNSLIGVGLVEGGKVAISLGTSDTYFGFMPEAKVDPAAEGHVFGSPTGHYMSLICFINGSLAREQVRDSLELDWEGFSRELEAQPPGNRGRVMLPYFDPEITPKVLEPGVRRYRMKEDDPANVRAVVEAQALSMAIHSEWMGVKTRSIYATGGASENRAILQVLADVHDADVYRFEVTASAALGAALRAYHGERKAAGREIPWSEVVSGFAEPDPARRVRPRAEYRERYDELKKLYKACEDHALRGGADPTAELEKFEAKYPS